MYPSSTAAVAASVELVHVERREQGVSGPYTRTDAACGDHDDGGGNDGWKRGTPASSAPLMMNLYRRVRHAAQTTFFPAGYPQSVSHNYVAYVGWQGVQHMTSAANGSLASAFMLYAAGMGSASALPTAGAVNWVLKDGVGQIGTMVFARWMSRDFDSSARLWYCIAALKLNIAVWYIHNYIFSCMCTYILALYLSITHNNKNTHTREHSNM